MSAGKPLMFTSLSEAFARFLSSATAVSSLLFVLAMRMTWAPLLTNC